MNRMFGAISIASIMILFSACASTPNNYIEREARQYIDEVDAYLAVTQDEIYADIVKSNTTAAAGGGLLFALIDAAVDNSRTKSSEELIEPIRDSLIDYDYAEVLQGSIEEKLTDIEWMRVNKVELERSLGDGHLMKKIEKSDVSAVLFMTADYKLTPNFDSVTTSVSLIMFPNKEALFEFKEKLDNNENPVDEEDNIYRNNIVVNMPLGLTGDKETNAQQLADTSGEKLIEALEKSARKIAEDIFDDIQLEDAETEA